MTTRLLMCRFYPCGKESPNSFTCQNGGGRYCGKYRALEDAKVQALKVALVVLLLCAVPFAGAAPRDDPGKADPDVWWNEDVPVDLPKVVNGTDGEDGTTTIITKTVKEVVTIIVSKDVRNGTDGANGLSAYELAVLYDRFNGTVQEWLLSLKAATPVLPKVVNGTNGADGKDGVDIQDPQGPGGLSAYDLAVLQGYSGSVEQWLASLKGEPAISIDESRIRRLEDFLWVSLAMNFMVIMYLAWESTFYGKREAALKEGA